MTADWESFLKQRSDDQEEELDLSLIEPGDTVSVVTRHTSYIFSMINQQEADLRCSRTDRPTGRVRISGCGFAFSTTFKPRRLFCGGRLEFVVVKNERPTRFRTTSIESIIHRHGGSERFV